MLRPLRITKPTLADSSAARATPDVPEGTAATVASVARRYLSRGLSLAQLVAAGEDGWQRAKCHFGADTSRLDRWGAWWVRESILRALDRHDPACASPR